MPVVSDKTTELCQSLRSEDRQDRSESGAVSRGGLRILMWAGAGAFQFPGGGEVQLLKTAEYLCRAGVKAKLFNPWRDKLREADCLHLFGTLREHLPLVQAAKDAGASIVLSPIAWYDLRSRWCLARNPWQGLWHGGRFLARACLPAIPSWRRTLYHNVDLLLPNSRAEARQLVRYFHVQPEKIRVVPNGADLRFQQADPEAFSRHYGVRDYVLYPGRIEPRKNQLTCLKALRGLDVPIVILGDPVPAYRDYTRACREAAGANVHFVPAVEHTSPLLASAYRGSRCVVLASWFETPGLAALEAALAGAPLVVTRRGSTREYFGREARYVDPGRPSEIRQAVCSVLANPQEAQHRAQRLSRRIAHRFSWTQVAQACQEAYENVAR